MLKQPIYVEFNLDAKVNNSKLIAISHVDDKYSETLEVAVKQNERFVYMGGVTVIARMVLHREKDYLLSDNVPCTVNDNGNILIPFDNAVVKTRQGTVKIEVNITRDADELTLQFPLWVSVKGSILDGAEVTPDSEGTIPDLLKEAADALDDATAALERLGSYDNLADKPQINGVELSGNKSDANLNLQHKLTAGDGMRITNNHIIELDYYYNYLQMMKGQPWAAEYTVDKPRFNTFMYASSSLYGSSLPENKDCFVISLAENLVAPMTQIAIAIDSKKMYVRTATNGAITKVWSKWKPVGGSEIASGVVNQNGTISFYDADGNLLFTTTGASVIGPQGDPGDNYVLTPQDKTDIANIVLQELPTTQGVLYGNASN